MVKFVSVGALVVGIATVVTFAGDGMTVQSLSVSPGLNESIRIYTHDRVIDPAVTIDRDLSEQPVRPYMVRVQLPGTTTYIDPAANYLHQFNDPGQIDENHWIMRAQRIANSQNAQTVVTYYGSPRGMQGPVTFAPHMILLRPPMMPGMKQPQPDQVPVPQQPDKEATKVASSK